LPSQERQPGVAVLQFLAIVHAAIDHRISERFMRELRALVVNQRVRRDLRATLVTRPIFRSGQEPRPDALAPMILGDVPAFDVPYGLRVVAPVGMRTQSHFEKADEPAILCFRDQKNNRQFQDGWPIENSPKMRGVLFRLRFRPERLAQTRELVAVGSSCNPDGNVLRRCAGAWHISNYRPDRTCGEGRRWKSGDTITPLFQGRTMWFEFRRRVCFLPKGAPFRKQRCGVQLGEITENLLS
jgi:hypothetical protein